MGYCSETDIESEFKDVDFTTSTAVTTADVASFIDRASAYIDGKIASRYVTPVAGATSLIILKEICSLMVSARVEEILRQGQTEDEEGSRPKTYREKAEAMIKEIQDGALKLPDATSVSSSMFYSYNQSNNIEPTIKRDTRQW